MAKKSKPSKTKQKSSGGVKFSSESATRVPARQGAADAFVKRREEVAVKDREEFQTYLVAKEQADAKKKAATPAVAEKKRGFSRRTIIGAAAGTAGSRVCPRRVARSQCALCGGVS